MWLSIVLPTYNERGNIEPLLTQLLPLQQRFDLEILVVDDDSTDGTAELVRQLAHGEPRLRLVRRVGRSGLASAIKEGLLDATGDLAVVMARPDRPTRRTSRNRGSPWASCRTSSAVPSVESSSTTRISRSNRCCSGSSWASSGSMLPRSL